MTTQLKQGLRIDMKHPHPAIGLVLDASLPEPEGSGRGEDLQDHHTTSLSLARALAVGCLSGLDPSVTKVGIWDPAAGTGYAGHLLANALESSGVQVTYRGQEINSDAVAASRARIAHLADAEIAVANTLQEDACAGFEADLVIVDAPWGLSWADAESAVRARHAAGSFQFGLAHRSDGTWLLISLALEKLRSPAEGGGRVAALVHPQALNSGGVNAELRQRIVEAGLLESVTRLPDNLAPNTMIPLYLLTLTNRMGRNREGKVQIANFQAQFTTEHRHRALPVSALAELESGLRTWKPGPRNRTVNTRQFIRRDAAVTRKTQHGDQLSWRVATFNNTAIDEGYLESRYGRDAAVSLDSEPIESVDLDPSNIFGDNEQELTKDFQEKGWRHTRLSNSLAKHPDALKTSSDLVPKADLFIPMSTGGRVSAEPSEAASSGRLLAIELDEDSLDPEFLIAWLNSEEGIANRRRAIEASSSGIYVRALRSDKNSLMRWADELIIPLPSQETQLALVSADEQLASFQAALGSLRASIWNDPGTAEDAVAGIAHAFDESVESWLDQLPFPIASALWTAQTASTSGDRQRGYFHAWEAFVAFHATVLLSATRRDPGRSQEVESSIRATLQERGLSIERASFGTWIVIIEKTAKEFRVALDTGDADEVARVRRLFADLPRSPIERLISVDVVKKFNDVNAKRNRWLGHSGYRSDHDWDQQVMSLISDLRDLRQILGNVWAQLNLVRAGTIEIGRDSITQTAEIAVGTRSPFASKKFVVGEGMQSGELYLVRDGSLSPMRLGQFVQLRPAPRGAQYTSYFYNRTEGTSVHMVSYQYGPENEWQDDMESFDSDFGALR